ncbi:MAG: hypothetical protein ACLFS3_02535 [Candidatus Aenigmatarchaeota archaeon]
MKIQLLSHKAGSIESSVDEEEDPLQDKLSEYCSRESDLDLLDSNRYCLDFERGDCSREGGYCDGFEKKVLRDKVPEDWSEEEVEEYANQWLRQKNYQPEARKQELAVIE